MKHNSNNHLALIERQIIEEGIKNGSTKSSLANTIGKDNSTIGKEIKQHRKLRKRNSFNTTTDCIHFIKKYKDCKSICKD